MRRFFSTRSLRCLLIMGAIIFPLSGWATTPQYNDYSTTVYQGKPAALNIDNVAAAKNFRHKLMHALQQPVNFAGHYVITSWGCGAFCNTLAIVDVKTGKAYLPLIGKNDPDWQNYLVGWHYLPPKADSKLLLIKGQLTTVPRKDPNSLKGPFREKTLYYVWDNNQLTLIKNS